MTVTTVFAATSDGYIHSIHATYSNARAGAGLTVNTGADQYAGQYHPSNYVIYEAFLLFDTSSIPDGDVIDTGNAPVLWLWGADDGSVQDFTLEARMSTWSGSGLTTADWVAGASLGALTLAAHYATSAGWTVGAYNGFTPDAFAANINKTGNTEVLICSDRHRSNTAPTTTEYAGWKEADTAGTSNDPKLVVTHAPPPVLGALSPAGAGTATIAAGTAQSGATATTGAGTVVVNGTTGTGGAVVADGASVVLVAGILATGGALTAAGTSVVTINGESSGGAVPATAGDRRTISDEGTIVQWPDPWNPPA